jgi:hypothetical protein
MVRRLEIGVSTHEAMAEAVVMSRESKITVQCQLHVLKKGPFQRVKKDFILHTHPRSSCCQSRDMLSGVG